MVACCGNSAIGAENRQIAISLFLHRAMLRARSMKGQAMAKAKQINIRVADRPGAVAEAIRALADAKVNILSILGWNPSGTLQLVVDNPRAARKALDKANVQYTESTAEVVELPNKPGSLLKYLEKLAAKGINLNSISGATSKKSSKAAVVWTATDQNRS
jgi:hypothetical protein